jgi:hypothetical protein
LFDLSNYFSYTFFVPLEFKEKHGYIPSSTECLKARDPGEALTDDLRDVYVWMWMEGFPAAAHRHFWSKKIFFEKTPSAAMVPNSKKLLSFVSIATEAYLLVQLENNQQRWVNWIEDMDNNTKVTPKDLRTNVRYRTKYSSAFNGQEKFKGFSDDGLTRFEEIKQIVKANRAKDMKRAEGSQVKFAREEQILEYIQGSFAAKNEGDAVRKGKKKKLNQQEVEPRKRICRREEEDLLEPGGDVVGV